MRKLLLIYFFSFYSLVYTYAQEKEFYLSASSGMFFLGPEKDIEKGMKDAGFGDISPESWWGPAAEHPETKYFLIYDIEALFSQGRNGLSINYALFNRIETTGYDNIGVFGNYLFLNINLTTLSLNYSYRTANKMHNFFAGPALIFHKVNDESAGNNSPDTKNTKLGVNLGYLMKLFKKESWFVAFKSNFRWSPKSEIGPFVAEHELDEVYRSEFPATKVRTASLYLGLAVNVRLYKSNGLQK